MILFNSNVNPRICQEFETIRETALKVPETTEDITEMLSYIGHVKTKGIEELNGKIMVRHILCNDPQCVYPKCIIYQNVTFIICHGRRRSTD